MRHTTPTNSCGVDHATFPRSVDALRRTGEGRVAGSRPAARNGDTDGIACHDRATLDRDERPVPGDATEGAGDVKKARRTARDLVIWAVLTGGIVGLVLGWGIIGGVLIAFAVWQLVLVARRDGGLFVDQRAADRPGRPTVS
jgi:hypothetical protein